MQISQYVHIYMYVRMYICMCVCMYVRVYVLMYVYVYHNIIGGTAYKESQRHHLQDQAVEG